MANRALGEIREVRVRDRKAWRKWLEKNHALSKGVRLVILHKDSNAPGIRYEEAVEEALCFGWIDGTANKRDSDSFLVLFTPRKPKSTWSKSNRQRVDKLLKHGQMTPAGLAAVELAKRVGTWTALDAIDEQVIPEDLRTAFDKQPSAWKDWQAMAPSSRRMMLAWIASAKRPETRVRRIEETVRRAAKGQ